MPIRTELPEPEDFRTRLRDALNYLIGQTSASIYDLNDEYVLRRQRNRLDDEESSENWEFELTPHWEIELGDPDGDYSGRERPDFENFPGRAVLGGTVHVSDGKFKQYSFSLSLLARSETDNRSTSESDEAEVPCCWQCDDTDYEWRLARRFHFDIDVGDDNHESKPISHLQIGGNSHVESVTDNETSGTVHYCASPLDKPRIPYPPMDPILLLHMLITQYPNLSPANQESWQGEVRSSENILWDPYHEWLGQNYAAENISKPFSNLILNDGSDEI